MAGKGNRKDRTSNGCRRNRIETHGEGIQMIVQAKISKGED